MLVNIVTERPRFIQQGYFTRFLAVLSGLGFTQMKPLSKLFVLLTPAFSIHYPLFC
jgi:hypothetical protein